MSHIDDGLLHAYLDGELSERQRAELEQHLDGCDECRQRLDDARALIARSSSLLGELEPGALQPPAWPEIEARRAARAAQPVARHRVRPWLAWAASIVLAFTVGWLSHSNWSGWPGEGASPARRAVSSTAVDEPRAQSRPIADSGSDRFRASTETAELPALPKASDERASGQLEEAGQSAAPAASLDRDAATAQPAAPPNRADKQEADREAQQVTGRAVVPTEAPAPVAPAAGEEQAAAANQAVRTEGAEPQRQAYADALSLPTAERAAEPEAKEASRFFAVQPEEAETWLGLELRTLPDLDLQRIEVGPGTQESGGIAGLPAVRLVYHDAAGHEIVLIQQRVSADQAIDAQVTERTLTVQPSGYNAFRWYDPRGYLLTVAGPVSSDSLRALAAHLR